MPGRFEDRVAIVTGGAAGFGRAAGVLLLEGGAKVALVDWDAAALEKTTAELRARAGDDRVVPVVADVSQEADVARYVAETLDAYGRVDLFFNNAGIEGKMLPMTELEVADFDRVMAVNARGMFLGLREVLRVMQRQGDGGAIVCTASQAGFKGGARFSPYIASKHAVVGLARSAALEGAAYQVRVNVIAPGHIDTRMARDLTAQINPTDPQAVYDRLAASVPLGRYGTAEEVATLAVWLLSDEAAYISGSLHVIDGALNA